MVTIVSTSDINGKFRKQAARSPHHLISVQRQTTFWKRLSFFRIWTSILQVRSGRAELKLSYLFKFSLDHHPRVKYKLLLVPSESECPGLTSPEWSSYVFQSSSCQPLYGVFQVFFRAISLSFFLRIPSLISCFVMILAKFIQCMNWVKISV